MSNSMQISKNAWHYKLAYGKFATTTLKFDQKRPTDLCTYIRQVLKPIVMLMFLLAEAFALPYAVYLTVTDATATNVILGLLAILGAVTWIIAIVIGALCCIGYLADRHYTNKRANALDPNQPPSTFSIMKTYIKDKHDKVCRIIEVVD